MLQWPPNSDDQFVIIVGVPKKSWLKLVYTFSNRKRRMSVALAHILQADFHATTLHNHWKQFSVHFFSMQWMALSKQQMMVALNASRMRTYYDEEASSWKTIPLCSKFLNSSKLAQPGLSTIASPTFMTSSEWA